MPLGALARTPLIGQIHLVDPQVVELNNLQRYVLCARSDVDGIDIDGIKVEIVGKTFGGALQALPHQVTWASFVGANGYKWERVLVALDSRPMIGEPCKGACHVGSLTRGPK